jgi:hypothetical protein
MSHKQRIVSIRLAALLAVTCGLLLFGISVPPQSSAQKPTRSNITRWEYCAIISAQSKWPRENKEKYTGVATICYFRSSGCRREEVVFELTYSDFLKEGEATVKQGESYNRAYGAPARATESALSKAITKLGNDGWEMVGENRIDFSSGAEANNKAIYFKRRTSR